MRGISKYVEGVYRFAEQWPYLRYLGLGAWWAWIWLCYSGVGLYTFWPTGTAVDGVGLMYIYSTSAIALASIAAAIMWQRVTSLLQVRPVVVGVAGLACMGVLLISYSPFIGGDIIFALGSVLTGLGTSVLCFMTGASFGTLGRHEVLTAGCVAVIFAALLYFMGTGIPTSWQPIYIACMPVFSGFLFIMPNEDPVFSNVVASGHAEERVGFRSFVRLTIAAVVVAMTAGFAKGLTTSSMGLDQFVQTGASTTFLIFIGAIIICFVVNCGDIVKSMRRIYASLILLGVVVIFSSLFGLSLAYLNVGKELLWMMFTCLMAYMVFRFDFSPVRAFGLGQASYYLASALAWWLGMLAAPWLGADTTRVVVSFVLVIAIVAVFAFVFTDADIKFIFTWKHDKHNQGDQSENEEIFAEIPASTTSVSIEEGVCDAGEAQTYAEPSYMPPRELSLEQRIAAIPERFGISLREAEIMEYFAQGRSAGWIAEELTISKNTVRSHLRSIYTKLDVHTRQELLDFLKTVA